MFPYINAGSIHCIHMRAAIYSRVSTAEQNAENQIGELEQFCQQQKFTIIHRYTDQASGAKSDRAALLHMLDDARRHRFDVLVFWSLDRLSREGVLKTLQHLHVLSAAGVKWHSVQEPYIDSLGPFGDAIVGFIATIAEMERSRLRERTKAGLVRARAEGKILGRPGLIVDVDRLRASIAAGVSRRECARVYGISAATIANRLAVLPGSLRRS